MSLSDRGMTTQSYKLFRKHNDNRQKFCKFVHIRFPITTDNGSEFDEHLLIAKRLKTKMFFSYPYSSWEKWCI